MPDAIDQLKNKVLVAQKRRCSVCALPQEAHDFIEEARSLEGATVTLVWEVLRDTYGLSTTRWTFGEHLRRCLERPWYPRG